MSSWVVPLLPWLHCCKRKRASKDNGTHESASVEQTRSFPRRRRGKDQRRDSAKTATTDVLQTGGDSSQRFTCADEPVRPPSKLALEGCEYAQGMTKHHEIDASRWCVTKEDLIEFIEHVRQLQACEALPQHPRHLSAHHDDPRLGPNIHAVNDALIKPTTQTAGGMSWALMQHPDGLPVHLFVSHGWQEGVFEFVRRLTDSWPDDQPHAWICFLANPQTWHERDLGGLLSPSWAHSPLSESPFVRALQGGAQTLLVVPNSNGSIYNRLWCVLEIKLAIDLRIPVKLAHDKKHKVCVDGGGWTVKSSSGKLPPKRITSQQVIDDFDSVANATCTCVSDEVLIRSAIRGEETFINCTIRHLSRNGCYYP